MYDILETTKVRIRLENLWELSGRSFPLLRQLLLTLDSHSHMMSTTENDVDPFVPRHHTLLIGKDGRLSPMVSQGFPNLPPSRTSMQNLIFEGDRQLDAAEKTERTFAKKKMLKQSIVYLIAMLLLSIAAVAGTNS